MDWRRKSFWISSKRSSRIGKREKPSGRPRHGGWTGSGWKPNPVELVLQAYGACLAIGYAMNAAVRGIRIHDLRIDVEGEIDLPGFLGLEPPENVHMDRLPGYKNVIARVKIKADADGKTLKELHDHVVRTSPVGVTISRPVKIETELESIQERSAA